MHAEKSRDSLFKIKMFLKICSLGKSFITIPKVVLGLQKKVVQQRISCVEGQRNMLE